MTSQREPDQVSLFESGLSTSGDSVLNARTGAAQEYREALTVQKPTTPARIQAAPDKARARRSDPLTSHQAGASVVNLGRTRDAILKILADCGPSTDERIAEKYEFLRTRSNLRLGKISPSGLRSRRSELVDWGRVKAVGTGKTQAGRNCTVWGLA